LIFIVFGVLMLILVFCFYYMRGAGVGQAGQADVPEANPRTPPRSHRKGIMVALRLVPEILLGVFLGALHARYVRPNLAPK
jgi:hypothetical protein